jgi:hypothetical protein
LEVVVGKHAWILSLHVEKYVASLCLVVPQVKVGFKNIHVNVWQK